MEVFIDIITKKGAYIPAAGPTWIEAGVGKVVPVASRYAMDHRDDLGERLAVFHVEEMRYLQWPSFMETSVRNFDTVVVVACDDDTFDDGKAIEGYWLVTAGMRRRASFEAEARLRALENGRGCSVNIARCKPQRPGRPSTEPC